ncbi:MAG: acyl carrier protein [Planctomycetes bacterium]|nr:acyl carrier protein [Planctomycetota bacterium]
MAEVPENIEQHIKEIIVERLFLDISPEDLSSDESLTDEHGVDSVRLFDMIVGLEEDFEISFEDEELMLKNFDTVKSIAERVGEKIKAL